MKKYGIENKINRGRRDFTWFRMSCGHLLLHLTDSKILDSEFRWLAERYKRYPTGRTIFSRGKLWLLTSHNSLILAWSLPRSCTVYAASEYLLPPHQKKKGNFLYIAWKPVPQLQKLYLKINNPHHHQAPTFPVKTPKLQITALSIAYFWRLFCQSMLLRLLQCTRIGLGS